MTKSITKLTLLIIFIVLFLGASVWASGTSETGTKDTSGSGDNDVIATVDHAKGTEKFTQYPTRIVALEWSLAEYLMALGIQPVGVADLERFYSLVITSQRFDDSVVDVGTRQEPNLEAIATLQPDLILTVDFRSANSYNKLKAIAPTIVFDTKGDYNADQYKYMLSSFSTIAEVTGTTDRAKEVLNNLEGIYADARQQLKSAGKDGSEFAITQGWMNQNAAVMRLFAPNSMASVLLEKIGLKNAFQPSTLVKNGFETISIEGLLQVKDASFFYVAYRDDDGNDVLTEHLSTNKVWNSLPFVAEGRYYQLGDDIWLFGGPISAQSVIENTVKLLTN